ncbi:hypothetical protein Y88_1326 [Novosphingobium nitrogenifigens DSM 19370]|uniref:Uncharacterized protein n=1 Tax=Novosphingobium nitrogenifigens DSM 19370 TaxID=983920 RepID=F1Z7W1_9SPHN|nr:hypothetical protein Y88_1326 [Novosphingobium nitrogenifigens DSM 19370]
MASAQSRDRYSDCRRAKSGKKAASRLGNQHPILLLFSPVPGNGASPPMRSQNSINIQSPHHISV